MNTIPENAQNDLQELIGAFKTELKDETHDSQMYYHWGFLKGILLAMHKLGAVGEVDRFIEESQIDAIGYGKETEVSC